MIIPGFEEFMKKPPHKLLSTTCLGAILATGLCVFAWDAFAANKTWNNAGSTDWTDGANWTGGAPGGADTAIIDLGATGPNVVTTVPTVTDVRVGTTAANGTLNISGGGIVSDTLGYIGLNVGSTGTVTVDGTGSSWTNTSFLIVGNSGTGILNLQNAGSVSSAGAYIGSGNGSSGTLNITSGGQVTSSTAGSIGNAAGATGIATIDGAGSSWTNATDFRVGNNGSGTLTIQNGGQLSNTTQGYIAVGAASNSTATVNGTGSSWTSGSFLSVGYGGTGTLNIQNGGTISSTQGLVGHTVGSIGTATVNGTGSSWANTTGNLTIGNSGTGTLNVQNGGSTTGINAVVGNGNGAVGAATIDGTGSSWTNSSNFYVGNSGTGTLNVQNGGRVSNITGYIGNGVSGIGTATVDGSGSSWTNSSNFAVGNSGTGTLNVQNGGSISDVDGFIGNNAGSTGTATVSGSGSSWTNSNRLYLGSTGTGTLTISNGGSATTGGDAFVGTYASANGTLTINSGASLITSGRGSIGEQTNALGAATINGTGSRWTTSSYFEVGNSGTGTLTVTDSGMLQVSGGTGTTHIATNAGSTGTLNIGADALVAAAAPGTLSTLAVTFGSGTGTLVFNHTDANYTFDPTITGNGTIEAVAGTTILAGDLSGFTGTADLSGGILEYAYGGSSTITATMTGAGTLDLSSGGTTTITSNSAAFAGTTTVNNGSTLSLGGSLGGTLDVSSGGTLKGTGTAEDVTTNTGSVIAPGNSIGTLTVVNLVANPGSTYEVEIETDGTSDLIHATGTATLNGGTVELIPFSGVYKHGLVYTIVTADGGVAGTYDDITLSQPSLFITPTLSYDATNVYATTARSGVSFASVADTNNQRAAAAAADSLDADNLAYAALAGSENTASAQAAFDQLSGEIYAGLQNALIGEQHSIGTMLFDRLDRLGEQTASIEPFKVAYAGDHLHGMVPKGRRMNVWAQGFGSWSNVDGNANSAGVDSNSGGVMLGAEGDLNDAWQGGGAIGYSVTNADSSARASKAQSKNYHAALYAGTHPEEDEPVLRLGANATWHALQSARDIEVNGFSDHTTGDYSAYTAQAFVDVSQPVSMDSNSTLAPFGTLSYTHQSTQEFTERGGDASLNVDGTDSDFVSSTFGLRGSRRFEFDKGDIEHATLNASLGWKHTLGDVTPESSARFASGSDSFTVEGAALASDALVYDTSFTVEASHNLSFGITYSGQLAADAISQSLRGQIKYSF